MSSPGVQVPAGQVEPEDTWEHGDAELADEGAREVVTRLGEAKEGGGHVLRAMGCP